jgi:hypothetical protein
MQKFGDAMDTFGRLLLAALKVVIVLVLAGGLVSVSVLSAQHLYQYLAMTSDVTGNNLALAAYFAKKTAHLCDFWTYAALSAACYWAMKRAIRTQLV